MRTGLSLTALLMGLTLASARAQAPMLTSLSPTRNALAAPPTGPVVLTFSQPMSAATASGAALTVSSSARGGLLTRPGANGTFGGAGTNTISFQPAQPFLPGEVITVVTTRAATAVTGDSLAAGHVYQFTVAAGAGGTFVPGARIRPTGFGMGPTLTDFTGDGLPDLLVGGGTPPTIGQIWRGDGLGGLLPGPVISSTGSPTIYTQLLYTSPPADYDGDGDLDLAVVTVSPSPPDGPYTDVSLLYNDGTGTFSRGLMVAGWGPGGAPGLVAGDLNADGTLDLLIGDGGQGGVIVVAQRPNGTYARSTRVPIANQPAVADIDQDGDLDLLGGSQSGIGAPGFFQVSRNDGRGRFGPVATYATAGPTDHLRPVDIDGDGDLDVLTASPYSQILTVRYNDGTGAFATRADLNVGLAGIHALRTADVDGDGDLDVLGACYHCVPGLQLFLNDGLGGLTLAPTAPLASGPNSSAWFVSPGDIDQDGDLDLVVQLSDTLGPYLRVLLNQPPTGLPLDAATSLFTLSPNPAHHTIHLTNAPAGPLTLLDAVGRVVRTAAIAAGQPEATLSVEGLAPGLYTVRAGPQTRRLVVE